MAPKPIAKMASVTLVAFLPTSLASSSSLEPNTLSTLEWPANVLIFHAPEPSDSLEVRREKIDAIKAAIEPTQDPTQENPFAPDELTHNTDNHFSR
jgi:hypothetical protein